MRFPSAIGFGGGSLGPGASGQHFKVALKSEKRQLTLVAAWMRRVLFGE